MSEKIVTLNEEAIKGEIRELVRGSVEETLNNREAVSGAGTVKSYAQIQQRHL